MNSAELAYAAWQAEEEKERQRNVMLARRFYDGDHDVKLTPRMLEFLGISDDNEFTMNVCRTVVEAVTDRLIIADVNTSEKGDDQPVATWASDVAKAVHLPALQMDVHTGAARDGEYFVFVDWDAEKLQPRFTPHWRYCDLQVDEDADNFGCKAHYPDDDTTRPLQYVSKRWIEDLGNGRTRNRATLYFPDRIEKYEVIGGALMEFQDDTDTTWPLPWVRSDGTPRGIPIMHWRNTSELRPEHWDAIGAQRAFNKTVLDIIATGDTTAFRIFVAIGWQPTTDGQPLKGDGSNAARLAPGQIIGTLRTPAEASFQAVEGSNNAPLLEQGDWILGKIGLITSTPQTRILPTRQVSSAESQKEQNESLFAKCRKRQNLYDAAWRECFDMARKLANDFGNAGIDETVQFVLSWEPLQARDTADERDEWRVKKELGIPQEVIWQEMGYSNEQIQAMKGTDEYKAKLNVMQTGMVADGGEGGKPDPNPDLNQDEDNTP
jgi:hypothetical protein